MNFDLHELHSIQAAAGIGRMDMYTAIHKALRAWMSALICQLGSMDTADEAQTRAVLDELGTLLDVMQGHLETENTLVHPAIEARRPGSLESIESDHRGHELAIARLREHSKAVAQAGGAQREALALFLYREFALFMAENIEHMQVEESQNHQLLWSAYSDAELQELHGAILASLPPAKMAAIMRWMIPAVPHAVRVEMLGGMRGQAPAEVFAGMLEIAQARLAVGEWTKLTFALGLPQVPGLVEMGVCH